MRIKEKICIEIDLMFDNITRDDIDNHYLPSHIRGELNQNLPRKTLGVAYVVWTYILGKGYTKLTIESPFFTSVLYIASCHI